MRDDLSARLDRQQETLDAISLGLRRQTDTLTIMGRHLVEILERLTPEADDGETALERLLAQLVAQGQEQLRLLRSLAGMAAGGDEPPGRPRDGRNG